MSFRLLQILLIMTLCTGCRSQCYNWFGVRNHHAQAESEFLEKCFVPETLTLTLEDCIDLALERNLELQLKAWEARVQREVTFRETWKLLPELETSWESRGRDTSPGSSSKSLVAAIPPAPPSVSSEKNSQLTRSRATWNLLNFGISYHLAQQEKNRTLILGSEYDRLKQNLILNVTEEFWIAVSAKLALERSEKILEKAYKQKEVLSKLIGMRILSEIAGLENQEVLLDLILDFKEYQKIYYASVQKLTQLLAISPNQTIDLVIPQVKKEIQRIEEIQELDLLALKSRPELFQKDMEEVIAYHDVRIALYRMVPGLELFTGYDRDSNVYLVKNNWLSAGFRVVKDLFAIPQHNQDRIRAMQAKKQALTNRMMSALGVVTQVHLAAIEYEEQVEKLKTYEEKSHIRKRMLEAARKSRTQGEFHEFELIQYEMESLLSEVEYTQVYGETMTALEKVNNAIGIPRYLTGEHL